MQAPLLDHSVQELTTPVQKQNSGTSICQAVTNLVKNIVGVGILSLPFGVAEGTGIGVAIAATLVLGLFSCYTFALLGRQCSAFGVLSFGALGGAAFGPNCESLFNWTNTVYPFFTCVSFSIVLADSFRDILTTAHAPEWLAERTATLLVTTSFVLLPLCLLQDLRFLSCSSLVGNAAIAYTIAFMAVRRFDHSYAPGGEYFEQLRPAYRPEFLEPPQPWMVGVRSLVLACTLSTAFMAHYNSPRFYEQLRDRSASRHVQVSIAAFAIVIAALASVSWIGFTTFGVHCQGLILNNYSTADPLATGARIAIGASVMFTYPLGFTALRDGVASLLGLQRAGNPQLPSALPFRAHASLTLTLVSAVTALACLVSDLGLINSLRGAIVSRHALYFSMPRSICVRSPVPSHQQLTPLSAPPVESRVCFHQFGALIMYAFPAALVLSPRVQLWSWTERTLAWAILLWAVLLGVGGSTVTVLNQLGLLGGNATGGGNGTD
jgi:amino acid permease